MNIKNLAITIACLAIGLPTAQTKAETISLYDGDFTILSLPSGAQYLSVRWGTWNAGTSTFTQQVFINNDGYVDMEGQELSVAINQTNNGVYTAGSLLAMAIFTDGSANASSLAWNNSYTVKAILTDASWTAPTFNNNAIMVDKVFTANTTAVVGSYSYNGGLEQITLVPEPSTGALMMIGAAGLVALRRLRKV